MKRLCLCFMVVVLFILAGCVSTPTVQIGSEGQEVVAKITGRRAGFELVKSYPNIAKEVDVICREIVSRNEPDLVIISIRSLVAILGAEIEDPLLAADIKDIMSFIKIDGIEISVEQLSVIKAVVEGLSAGIEIGGRNEEK